MNKPNTEYALVRCPRTDENGNKMEIRVHIVKTKDFDFTDYSFLRMHPSDKVVMEEWVATKELEFYRHMK